MIHRRLCLCSSRRALFKLSVTSTSFHKSTASHRTSLSVKHAFHLRFHSIVLARNPFPYGVALHDLVAGKGLQPRMTGTPHLQSTREPSLEASKILEP